MDPDILNTYDHYDIYFNKDDVERHMRGYEAYEQFLAMSNQEAGGSGSGSAPKRTHTYIPRQREEAKQRLFDDYFGEDDTRPKYPEENFRRRSAISQLAYVTTPDAFDEYLQIDERCS
ncbi:hypothetical protein Tco_0585727 [Tanacetum coccineum]